MPISFECSICGKRLKARDNHVGMRTKCPGCQTILVIPEPAPAFDPELGDGSPYDLEEPPKPTYRPSPPATTFAPQNESVFHPWSEPSRQNSRSQKFAQDEGLIPLESATADSSGSTPLREYVYCLLVLTLIPLMISLLGKEDLDIDARIEQTLDRATPEQRARILPMLANDKLEKEVFLAALPDGKLAGAHLPHDTQIHWLYGLISATVFLGLLAVLFQRETVNPLKLAGIGMFTGTVGIVLLLVFQFCAGLRFGRIPLGKAAIFFLLIKFIGWSYDSALDPNSSFWLSAFGFTFGVGLCEEICKAIPIIATFHAGSKLGWRGGCLFGLASGVGFGVSEGIMYSGNMYNGIVGADTYLLRFVSCVALHAMWAGSVGMTAYRKREFVESADDFGGFALAALQIVAIPMVLHGFYDTLLKKDMNAFALLTALLSFAYFAYQVETSRSFDRGRKRRPAFGV